VEAQGATTWPSAISNEAAKRAAAASMAERLRPGDTVGVGSGSTSFLTVQALAARGLDFVAVTTSDEVEAACASLGVPTTSLHVARPDWSFDGADEVDPSGDLIKGRGGALLREKLVLAASPERYIVVDASKQVERLGTRFPVPLEVVPEAVALVRHELASWPVSAVVLRTAGAAKDGPVITEHGNVLLDVRFEAIGPDAERDLKALPGVVDSGLFQGYHPQVVVA
jgi:ribose 5-phosphate isomerase A